ncbi:MAG: hypothetical protein HQ558_03495 [Candidatus Omnitrophica bacterium]|nr:hypothetical protein [Candidatus Omnitrophota bacterium]
MVLRNCIAVIVLAVLVAGCATGGSSTRSSRRSISSESAKTLDVAMRLKFEDVPVPSGFKPVVKESFTFQNEVLRVGILKYVGRASATEVVKFYKDQMPLYNWRFLNMLEYDRRIMNFDREDQTCIVVVEPAKMSTYITITVAPKGGRASTYRTIRSRDDQVR